MLRSLPSRNPATNVGDVHGLGSEIEGSGDGFSYEEGERVERGNGS
jgi:hypothetical protein